MAMADRPIKKRGKNAGSFKPGNAGGPGRPRGVRNKASIVLEKMMADDGADVVRAVIERAKDGEVQAARIVLDRILPIRKGRAVEIDLPVLETAGDVVAGIGAVARAMATGEITPEEAQVMASVIEVQRKAIETTEIEARLDALEERQK